MEKYYFATVTGGHILGAKIYIYEFGAKERAEKNLSMVVENDSSLTLRTQEITKEQFERFKESDVVKIFI